MLFFFLSWLKVLKFYVYNWRISRFCCWGQLRSVGTWCKKFHECRGHICQKWGKMARPGLVVSTLCYIQYSFVSVSKQICWGRFDCHFRFWMSVCALLVLPWMLLNIVLYINLLFGHFVWLWLRFWYIYNFGKYKRYLNNKLDRLGQSCDKLRQSFAS